MSFDDYKMDAPELDNDALTDCPCRSEVMR